MYESGRETVRVRLPEEAAERFRAVVVAAEAILRGRNPAGGRSEAFATLRHRSGLGTS